MAKQDLNLGNANQGDGDTLRGGGVKIKANFDEIYAEFGDGTNLSSGNTAGDILVADGTKFANVTTSGDISISNTGAINLRTQSATSGQELTIGAGSAPSSTSNKLYNVGGTLYWNGSTIGVAGGGSFSSFTVSGDSGSDTVTDGNTVKIATGAGLSSSAADASGTPTVTISLDLTTGLTFEGATENAHETTLAVTDPTADRTITLPDATDTLVGKATTDVLTNKTIDADGTGNSITNIENANIKAAAAIAVNKLAAATASRALVSDSNGFISASAVTSTEIGYLDGVSSAIQTQLDAKQPTISASARIDAAHIHDGTVSNTEFGYLNGVTSNIQTQLDAASGTITVQDEGSALSTGATTLNFVGAGVTASGNSATKTITISGGGATNLNALTDATVSSADGGQVLLHDDSDSFDNKYVKVFENNSAYTTALPMFFGAQMFTVSAAGTTNGYTFENYNSDGTDANNSGSGAGPTLTIFEDQVVVFHLKWGSSHPFAIRTGASGGSDGTNLVTGNGGDNLIHIAPNGTVTSGTSANAKTSGYLIWKVPHFGSNQASTYYYQCTAHPGSMYGLIKIRTITY